MPRVGRIYQRALCYHVMNRGVNRGMIFEDDADREVYAEALMSGVAKALIGRVEGERVIGTRAFANTLKMERGRYRVKRGRPVQCVRIRS